MTDKITEHIKFETELLKLTTLVAVATGGGSLGLILGEHTPLRLGLAGLGILATVALVELTWRSYRRVRELLAQTEA